MLQTYCIVRYTNNTRNISQTYEPRRYAGSNKGTPALLRTTPLLVCSSIATTLCRSVALRIEVIAAYALNYLKLRFLSANMIALIGTVLYNAIKEYYNDRMRKIIYFYSYTIETIYANYIKNSRSNVTVLDDYYNNDVNNILIKCIDNKRQRYNTLIEDYNCAGKREDNILTVDKCRTSYSNKEDIEANEREKETRVQLRKLLGEIHDILLREFCGANDFIESVTYNDDEQELELEDCNALVERYEEEINCSDLYSTM
ncbi:hypothetical protein HBH92_242460 [Parastagonospora nodorum]|nr:hypothetical protein HBH93_246130 [Parastagonospora nodorum]KAH4399946.1 hypothetical protein HBH92_242460 [Parastagonospora nodorum]KAH4428168.1 hypothetical protein HBH91_246780 [Parastagonospora nodorum]KAH4522802.1 hypothetical protein HBH85_244770 [Parastagonospora nodorum]KAH4522950.1 hypothetical protein HBH86_244540 [Parastagonospora nodorum]